MEDEFSRYAYSISFMPRIIVKISTLYVQNLFFLSCAFFLLIIVWLLLIWRLREKSVVLNAISVFLFLVSVYGVLAFTVIGRRPSKMHEIVLYAHYNKEFFREMLMNAFLYLPFGLSLSVLIGPWSILSAFLLSIGIETWQYFAGTGLAQGTDVICNTLGCAIGVIPWIVNRWLNRR